MRTTIKIIEHAHRVISEFSLTLHAPTPATSEPKHILLAKLRERARRESKAPEKPNSPTFSVHYFICLLRFDCIFFIPTTEKGKNRSKQEIYCFQSELLNVLFVA